MQKKAKFSLKLLSFVIAITMIFVALPFSISAVCDTHTPGDAVVENRVEPSCTREGSFDLVVYCSVCNRELSREGNILSKASHAYNILVSDHVAPTCVKQGKTAVYKCVSCDATKGGAAIKTLSTHTKGQPVEENIVEATVDHYGWYDYVFYCVYCGVEISRDKLWIEPIVVHVPGEPIVTGLVKATCNRNGSYKKVVKCVDCGIVMSSETVVIPKTGEHRPVIVPGIKPNCTNEGLSDGKKCGDCGTILEARVVLPVGGPDDHVDLNNDRKCDGCGTELPADFSKGCGKSAHRDNIIGTIQRMFYTFVYRLLGLDMRCCRYLEWYNSGISIQPKA